MRHFLASARAQKSRLTPGEDCATRSKPWDAGDAEASSRSTAKRSSGRTGGGGARLLSTCTILLILGVSGCAFDDGNPWGRAEISLEAAFDPPASRLDDGLLRTAKDYRVDIDDVAVTFAAIEIEVATSGEAGFFDPSSPPEGYSLCHNGHCHAADGSLVDYEDIELEQSGGDSVLVQTVEQTVSLTSTAEPVSLGECFDNCHLERGELGLVRLRISGIRITGTVTDVRDRLTEPVELDVDVALDAEVAVPVSGTVAIGEPGLAIVELDFQLSPGFLDDVDFASGAIDAESVEFSEALDVNVEMQNL